mmetsp:Transcript_31746/g.35572  ORF Transcript_31746/g.35572 Transcript_31746/m.35572 type:complete len:614 (+) Transcript_31746:169-2010(+)|eukprot:CAMPEP_0170824978 /NCGR_PEP_ID=MMETSP0733-20121128/45641_1 /TAXON_ID=186038 /ORGANISM="Fragilariopsis kerguelensis, Strain L26-C5" /LENGTH=613 /DNA_ID=CAMNT_0011188361 /DNA_START=86 /DNA_END=1927 /DNA_ORIENTATION=-
MKYQQGARCCYYVTARSVWFHLFLLVVTTLFSVSPFYASCIAWTTKTNKCVAHTGASISRKKIWGRGGDVSTDGVATTALVNENEETSPQNKKKQRVILLMDSFCEYHNRYLSDRARDVYNVRSVHVLSIYMAGYLRSLKQEGNEISSLPLIPMPSSPEEAIEWRRQLVDKLLQLDVDHNVNTDTEIENNNNIDIIRNGNNDIIELKGLICESDPGLDDAERLSMWLNVTNHNGFNEARRNKFLTISTLASKNIPTVRQKLCTKVEEATEFATTQLSLNLEGLVVVKPIRGCASDDVFLCEDLESVRSAFGIIKGSTVLGSPRKEHDSVLVQEYAVGQEYAVDTVSKDGKLKIAAVWKYDKRPQPPTILQKSVGPKKEVKMDGNNDDDDDDVKGRHSQVYYATKLYDDDDDENRNDNDLHPLLPVIYEYLNDCLNALDIRWGVTHSELIVTSDGPRLVEVNARQHNMDFVPLTDNAVGYNVYDMLLAAYLGDGDDDRNAEGAVATNEDEQLDWDLVPNYPSTRMNGAMVHLVNDKKGILKRLNEKALYEIQRMDSVWDLEVYPGFLEEGISYIEPTIDIKSDAGWIQLLHPSKEIFERDYERIIELMPSLFEV